MSGRLEFRLSMPSRGSWNGGWSGAAANYVVYRTLTKAQADAVMDGTTRRTWLHHWSDGWTAQITGRVMDKGERRQKSDGFCGYDWMVTNILRHGYPATEDT